MNDKKSLDTKKMMVAKIRDYMIPLVNDNIHWGNIKFDVEELTDEKLSDSDKTFDLVEMLKAIVALEKDIELDRKLSTSSQNDYADYLLKVFSHVYLPWKKGWIFEHETRLKEEEIFKLIKNEGPIVLRNLKIQEKIYEWLFDKDVISEKINKIRDSLLEFSLGPLFQEQLHRQGRPPVEIIKKFDVEWLIDLHDDLMAALGLVKSRRKTINRNNSGEVMRQALVEVIGPKKEMYKKGEYTNGSEEIEKIVHDLFFNFKAIRYSWDLFLRMDRDFEREYYSFRWEPNTLATAIIAKFLNISVSKAEKIIYPKKKK